LRDPLLERERDFDLDLSRWSGEAERLLSGEAERLRSGDADRFRSGEADRFRSGEAERFRSGEAERLFTGEGDRFRRFLSWDMLRDRDRDGVRLLLRSGDLERDLSDKYFFQLKVRTLFHDVCCHGGWCCKLS